MLPDWLSLKFGWMQLPRHGRYGAPREDTVTAATALPIILITCEIINTANNNINQDLHNLE